MDSKIAEQIVDDLAPTFERIESQSAAILQFMKEKGIATDEQLAPYLEQASAASSVRWRALRVRMVRLFSMAEKSDDESRKKENSATKTAKETKADGQGPDVKPEAKKDEAGEGEPGKSADARETAQKQKDDAGPTGSQVAAQPRDERAVDSRKEDKAPDSHNEEDAA